MSNQTEPLYSNEDAKHDALILAHTKGIPQERALYFAKMKKGRESISLARGLEPFIEVLADPHQGPEEPSILYLAICNELTRRGLNQTIRDYASALSH